MKTSEKKELLEAAIDSHLSWKGSMPVAEWPEYEERVAEMRKALDQLIANDLLVTKLKRMLKAACSTLFCEKAMTRASGEVQKWAKDNMGRSR